ncbi:multiple PDZ domain protein-like isoform X3 [Gordionus sp. m RMFG-2023]|uniref:multiple PDZ domain protein-like isoform X3 n=1 Tax=Gordionus sp. m RMFG-2023 TaxID=3053472 RepID=UPI0031FD4D5A
MALYQNSLNVLHSLYSLKYKNFTAKEIDDSISLLEDPLFQKILTINDSLQNLKYYVENYDLPLFTSDDFAVSLTEGLILSPKIAEYVETHFAGTNKRVTAGSKSTQISPVHEGKPEYDSPISSPRYKSPSISTEKFAEILKTPPLSGDALIENSNVKLFRPENASLGISILGLQNESNDSVGVFVKDIDADGIAGRNGQLKEGDQILAINGVRLQNVPHKEAISLLQNSKGALNLLIERQVKKKRKSSTSENRPIPITATNLGPSSVERKETGDIKDKELWTTDAIDNAAATQSKEIERLSLSNIPYELTKQLSFTSSQVEPSLDEAVPALAPDISLSKPLHSLDSRVEIDKNMVLDTEWAEIELIELKNEGTGLGFGIVGGKSTGVVVKSILPGSVAYIDGHMKNGDHILQIGDVNLRGMSSDQVASVLRHCGPYVKLVVARGIVDIPSPTTLANSLYLPTKLLNEQLGMDILPSQIIANKNILPDEPENLTEDELVEESETFERTLIKGSHGLGMTIAGYIGDEISGIFVKSIAIGSPANLDSYIKINDQIVEVDGRTLIGMSNQDSVEVLKNTGNKVHLKFVRYLKGSKHEQLEHHTEHEEMDNAVPQPPSETEEIKPGSKPAKELPTSRIESNIPQSSQNGYHVEEKESEREKLISSEGQEREERSTDESSSKIKPEYLTVSPTPKPHYDEETRDYYRKWSSVLGPDALIVISEFDKFKQGGGLGISLEGTVDVTEDGTETSPHHYIRSILPDGPLGINGKLRSGDELLEVNGQILYGKNHREVVRVLKETPLRVIIVCARIKTSPSSLDREDLENVEAIEGSIPSSYFFLPSTRPFTPEESLDTRAQSQQYFVNEEVDRRESGDRLFKAKSEGAISLGLTDSLHDITADSVRIKSRSLEPMHGLAMWSNKTIVVDLIKGDRGLGFSILDYQDPANPNHTVIVIRSLVPGGQAQLDGTIVPGDRLLFVNNVNLEGLTLDSAVTALKSAPKGLVRIGISKPMPFLVEEGEGSSEYLNKKFTPDREIKEKIVLPVPQEEPVKAEDLFLPYKNELAIEDKPLFTIKDAEPLSPFQESSGPNKYVYKTQINLRPSLSEDEIPSFKPKKDEIPVLPPLPHALERVIKIKKGLLHLGLTLEPEGIGTNGCIVSSVSPDGAIKRDGRVKVGDYITSINNESLRYVTLNQAKSILSRISLISSDISLNYIPSDDAAIHNQSAIMALQDDSTHSINLYDQGIKLSMQDLTVYIKYVDSLMERLIEDISESLTQAILESHISEDKIQEYLPPPLPQSQQDLLLKHDTISPLYPEEDITPVSNESLEIQEILKSDISPESQTEFVPQAITTSTEDDRTNTTEDNRWSPPQFIELTKDDNQSYGLSIVGGTIESDLNPDFDVPVAGIFIKNVFPSGPAFRNGRLKTGDRILEINNYKVNNSSLDEAVKIIRESKNRVQFLVQSLMGSNEIPYTFTFTPKKSDTTNISTIGADNQNIDNTTPESSPPSSKRISTVSTLVFEPISTKIKEDLTNQGRRDTAFKPSTINGIPFESGAGSVLTNVQSSLKIDDSTQIYPIDTSKNSISSNMQKYTSTVTPLSPSRLSLATPSLGFIQEESSQSKIPTPVKVNYKSIDQLKKEFFERHSLTNVSSLPARESIPLSYSPTNFVTPDSMNRQLRFKVPITSFMQRPQLELLLGHPKAYTASQTKLQPKSRRLSSPPHLNRMSNVTTFDLNTAYTKPSLTSLAATKNDKILSKRLSEQLPGKYTPIIPISTVINPAPSLFFERITIPVDKTETSSRSLLATPLDNNAISSPNQVLSSPEYSSSSSGRISSEGSSNNGTHTMSPPVITPQTKKSLIPMAKNETENILLQQLKPPIDPSSLNVKDDEIIKKQTCVNSDGATKTVIIEDETIHINPKKLSLISTISSSLSSVPSSPTSEKLQNKYNELPGKIHIVELRRTQGRLGICLAGNKDRNKLSVFVVGINSEDAKKELMVGDEILEANNHVLLGRSHLNASTIIKNLESNEIKLIILRRANGLEEMAIKPTKANEHLLNSICQFQETGLEDDELKKNLKVRMLLK